MVTGEKRVYSVKEAARLLNISTNLAYRLCRQKEIPGVVFLGPRRMVVSVAAINKLLSESDNGHQTQNWGQDNKERHDNGNTERERLSPAMR